MFTRNSPGLLCDWYQPGIEKSSYLYTKSNFNSTFDNIIYSHKNITKTLYMDHLKCEGSTMGNISIIAFDTVDVTTANLLPT